MGNEQPVLNRSFIGKEYRTSPQLAKVEDMMNYARATNEENSRYYDSENPDSFLYPPLYPVTFLPGILSLLVDDSEEMNLNILRVVHAEQEIWWKERIIPDDEIIIGAKIMNIEQRGNNEILDFQIYCKREDVALVEMRYRLLLRGKKKIKKTSQKSTNETTKSSKMIARKTIQVTEDQGHRYADASGDHNPIHISDEIAQSVGLPRAILQGLCTMAFASQAIVDELLDGNSSRLRHMKVRFSNPVFMDDALTTEIYDVGIYEGELKEVSFQTKNASDIPVLIHGLARYSE